MLTETLKSCQILLDKCRSDKKASYLYFRLFEDRLNSIVRDVFVKQFWAHFSDAPNKNINHKPFLDSISFLTDSCKKIEEILLDKKYEGLKQRLYFSLKTQILSEKPYYLNRYLDATYMKAFKTFLNVEKSKDQENTVFMDVENELEEDSDEYEDCIPEHEFSNNSLQNRCQGCNTVKSQCDCSLIYIRFCEMNKFLREFDLLDSLVGDTVMNVARIFIERRVSAKGKSNYSHSYLEDLKAWVDNVAKKWILETYGMLESNGVEEIGLKLDQFLKDAYAEVRVSRLFDIILEYPNSEAALQDLKICLEQSTSSNFRLNLIDSVKQSIIENLLHPGMNTYDILSAYISAIKALRALDPTGLILQLVTEPVRRYLKSRDDTVRCIVTALTDEENNSELNREMIRSSAQTNENGVDGKSGTIEMNIPNEGEKCTALNFEKWKPDPIKLNSSDDLMKSSRFSDIVSILVNIYETKDLFVEEYQKLLSQRLLTKYDECNLDTELRNLELLTIRFSDCELHRCEVMLKDVQNSKRINKRILSCDIKEHELTDFKNLDVLIVSSPFWPEKFSPMASISDDPPSIQFPEEIEAAISTYTKAFEAIQASRTLHWRHHLGSVNLDLTIAGKTQNFTVSPLHASIIYLFKDKKIWRLSELMHKTSLPAATIRSRLALWQRNGVIKESGEDKYDLIV